jgi:hypothetical protein
MEYGKHEARRLAKDIEERRSKINDLRDQLEREQRTAERKSRRSQWTFLIIGAFMGVALQYLAQWIL